MLFIINLYAALKLWLYNHSGDHTETTEVVYDSSLTNYSKMLEMFWKNHDSTQRCSRQVYEEIIL